MATAPSITSITFDKASYLPGDIITATVSYVAGSSDVSQTFTGTAVDSVSGEEGTLQVSFVVTEPDQTNITVTDSGGRAWAEISDTGSVAKFTATA